MLLARVVGTVVATRKDPRLEGKKLLVLRHLTPEGTDGSGYVIAVDTVGAGVREKVIAVSGSSARNGEQKRSMSRPTSAMDSAATGIASSHEPVVQMTDNAT